MKRFLLAAFLSLFAVQGAWAVPVGTSPSWYTRDLKLVFIGDSHLNGQLDVATTSDTFATVGSYAASARDFVWTGSGVATYFKADSQINSTSSPSVSKDQSNSAVGATTGSFINLLPSALRPSYPHLGDITVANLGVGGSSTYTWAGEPAQAYVGYVGQANDGDTIAICGTTYTFKTVPAAPYDVLIGAGNATLANLRNAINAESTGWFAGTAVNPNCYAPNVPQSSIYLNVNALQVGTGGNALVISGGNVARITPMTNALAAVASQTFSGGSATSALYSNGKSKLSGFGTPSAIVICLGTNDFIRAGYRGRNTQNDYTTLLTNIQTDYPGVPIILWRIPATGLGNPAPTARTAVLAAIDAAVASKSNVYTWDMDALGMGSGNTLCVRADGIHLTNYCYTMTAQMLAAKLGSVLHLN